MALDLIWHIMRLQKYRSPGPARGVINVWHAGMIFRLLLRFIKKIMKQIIIETKFIWSWGKLCIVCGACWFSGFVYLRDEWSRNATLESTIQWWEVMFMQLFASLFKWKNTLRIQRTTGKWKVYTAHTNTVNARWLFFTTAILNTRWRPTTTIHMYLIILSINIKGHCQW